MAKLTNTFSEIDSALQGVVGSGSTASEISAAIVSGSRSVFSALRQAATRRVDLVMIGDSNQQKDNYGFTRGIDTFLSSQYGQYATPILDVIDAESTQSRTTRGFDGQTVTLLFAGEGNEPNHDDFWPNHLAFSSDITFNRQGYEIPAASHFNYSGNVKVWCNWGGYPTGSGQFKLGARYGDNNATIVEGAYISTNTGDYSLNTSSLDLSSIDTARPITAGMAFVGNRTMTAPFTLFSLRVENIDVFSGVSCHTLIAAPGESLYDFSAYVKGYSDQALTNYFSEVRRLQKAKGQDPIVVVYINSGLNDRAETGTPTQGSYGLADSSSVAGYLDNLNYIINRIDSIWQQNGWDESGLYYLNVASHVISEPNDTSLTAYRDGLKDLAAARANLTTVDLSELMTYQDGVNGGWYVNPTTDTEHLNSIGYDAVSALIMGDAV